MLVNLTSFFQTEMSFSLIKQFCLEAKKNIFFESMLVEGSLTVFDNVDVI